MVTGHCFTCLRDDVELTGDAPLTRLSEHHDEMFNDRCPGSGGAYWSTPPALPNVAHWVFNLNPAAILLLVSVIAALASAALLWWLS